MTTPKKIKFTESTVALGKNGFTKCLGLAIFRNTRINKDNIIVDTIEINAINYQGRASECWLEIPVSDIDQFIEILKSLK